MGARYATPTLAAFLFLLAAPARAADPPPHIAIRLAYDHGPGVDGCPDERGFRYELMGAFGYDPTEPPQIADFEAPPLLRVVLSRQGAQLRAVASEVNAAGRVLWGGEYQDRIDCPTLARNIALVIRVGIGVDAGPTRPPAPSSPPSMLAPVVAAVAPSMPPPSPSPKVRLGVGSALAFGVAPAAAVGFSMQLGLRWPDVSLSFEGRADLPAESEDLEIGTSMLSGTLLPCVHVWTYGAACGLLTLGSLRSTWLEGTSPTRTPATFTWASAHASGSRCPLRAGGPCASAGSSWSPPSRRSLAWGSAMSSAGARRRFPAALHSGFS